MAFEMEGLAELEKMLKQAEESIAENAEDAVQNNIQEIFEETQRRVPKDTGKLADSGRIEWVEKSGAVREAMIRYGDSNIDRVGVFYAAAVHEILDAQHDPPTGPKYVELPLIEGQDKFERDIAKAAMKSLGKKSL